jgi:hypothetical protein
VKNKYTIRDILQTMRQRKTRKKGRKEEKGEERHTALDLLKNLHSYTRAV